MIGQPLAGGGRHRHAGHRRRLPVVMPETVFLMEHPEYGYSPTIILTAAASAILPVCGPF